MNLADREITRKIRAAIVGDKSLSTYAHNIKIITQDGKVTLKGPVRTEKEKADVEAKAAAVAGATNVTSEIAIAPPKS
jgi:hyperosmotically inducible protein